MNYKLIKNSLNDLADIVGTVLGNRGVKDADKYMNLDDSALHDWSLLGNIEYAKECLLKHVNKNNNIHILVD